MDWVFVIVFVLSCAFLPAGQAGAKAQSIQIAENYFEQGDYKKAELTYQKVVKKNPNDLKAVLGLIKSYQQQEQYSDAEFLIVSKFTNPRFVSSLTVEKGYNYQLWGKDSLALVAYAEAQQMVTEAPNYAYTIGRAFESHTLLEQAVQVYETAIRINPKTNFGVRLARIYGEMGDIEKMFNSYLDLIQKNPAYVATAQRNFSQFVTEDADNEANVIFRKLLLKKSQEAPDLLYNELLSWLFIQQGNFKKAFTQEKAIARRSGGNIDGILALARIVMEAGRLAKFKVCSHVYYRAAARSGNIAGSKTEFTEYTCAYCSKYRRAHSH